MPVLNAAFHRWFDGSIATERGKPRVFYHGTRSPVDFEVFETGSIQDDNAEELLIAGSGDPGAYLGPHFAEEPEIASAFAMGRAAEWDRSRYVKNKGWHGRVIPVFLSLSKVASFDGEDDLLSWILENGKSNTLDDQIGQMVEGGEIEGDPDDPEVFDDIDNRKAALKAIRRLDSYGDENLHETVCEELGSSARHALIEQGIDGVRYKNEIEGGNSWIALVPGTVKSAIGNSGRWDREDPSILG